MTVAPSDPFRLVAHLCDDHEAPASVERMEADDLRRHHRQLHATTTTDHDHEDQP